MQQRLKTPQSIVKWEGEHERVGDSERRDWVSWGGGSGDEMKQ